MKNVAVIANCFYRTGVSLVNYSILEQEIIGKVREETARKGIPGNNNEVLYHGFTDRRTFEIGLTTSIQKLFGCKPEEPKLLIISAHGIPRTGTFLDAGNFQIIDFWEFQRHFLVLPQNFVVYLSCCFGAYPSADAFQSGQGILPIVVGPLVDITFQHANKFQNQLIEVINRHGTAIEPIMGLVLKWNEGAGYTTQYGGRYVIGVLDRSKKRHPIEAEGIQLAAPVEKKRDFKVLGFLPPDLDIPYYCILRDDSGRDYLASIGDVIDLSSEFLSLIGKTISSKSQIIQNREDGYVFIELRQAYLKKET